jgi:hypothetical protein
MEARRRGDRLIDWAVGRTRFSRWASQSLDALCEAALDRREATGSSRRRG